MFSINFSDHIRRRSKHSSYKHLIVGQGIRFVERSSYVFEVRGGSRRPKEHDRQLGASVRKQMFRYLRIEIYSYVS